MCLWGRRSETCAVHTVVGHAGHLCGAVAGGAVLRKADGRGGIDERAVVDRADAFARRCHRIDAPVVVERQFLYAYLAVNAGTVVQIVLVDAVIHDVPVVGTGHVDHRVVACAVDFLRRILDDYDGIGSHLDRTCRRLGGSVGHVVVRGARVVDTPQEVVDAVPVEHICALAVSVVGKRTAAWRDGVLVADGRHHVVGQQAVVHLAVAVVEIGLSRFGVCKHVGVNHLSAAGGRHDGLGGSLERTGGVVGHGHTQSLRVQVLVLSAEIEEILPFAVHPFLFDAGSPCVASGPGHVAAALQVENGSLVGEMNQVGTGEHVEIRASPAGVSVAGGIDVEPAGLARCQHLGVGMEPGQDGVAVGFDGDGVGLRGRSVAHGVGYRAFGEVLRALRRHGGTETGLQKRVVVAQVGTLFHGDKGRCGRDGHVLLLHVDIIGALQGQRRAGLRRESGQQCGCLFFGDGDYRAVARGKGAAHGGVLHEREGVEVRAGTELVVAGCVAVVHQNPAVLVDELEHTGALHRLGGLLKGGRRCRPLASQRGAFGCRETACRDLADAAQAFVLEETVVKRVGLVVHDVHVDGGRAAVIEVSGFALQVAEVGVGVAIVVLVVADGAVVGEQREVDHVLLGFRVPNGFGSPNACNVGERCAGVIRREVYGVVRPVDEVVRFHQHQSAVAAPAERTFHVRNGHIEPSVLAPEDMRVAKAAHDGGGVGFQECLSVVQRCVVVAVFGDGVIEIFVAVAREIHEEVVLVRLLLVYVNVESLSLAQLAAQQGCRQGYMMLLCFRCFQHASGVRQPFGITRLPGDEGSHPAHGGQYQLVVKVVALVAQGQVFEVVGQAFFLREVGHDRHFERFHDAGVAQRERGSQCGRPFFASERRTGDDAVGSDDRRIACRPLHGSALIGGGQVHVVYEMVQVGHREGGEGGLVFNLLQRVLAGLFHRVDIGIHGRSDGVGPYGAQFFGADVVVPKLEIGIHGTFQRFVAGVAAAPEVVLHQFVEVGGGYRHFGHAGAHAVDADVDPAVGTHDDSHVEPPSQFGEQGGADRHALLAGVVGLGNGVAVAFGTVEQVARR